MQKKLQLLTGAHIALWVTTAAWAALSELGLVPADYAAPTPETTYALDLLSIVTAIGGGWAAMRLLALDGVRRKIAHAPLPAALGVYARWATLRLAVVGLALWYNVAVYYACTAHTTAAYCLLIAAGASLFCIPSAKDFEALRSDNGKKP